MANEDLTLEKRIEQSYRSLPPAERKLADLILGFPADIATYSASELATMAGVSKAAATRLFRRLGYADFGEVRRHARDAGRWGSPVYLNSRRRGRESGDRILSRHLHQDISNLERTLARLSTSDLLAAVEAIAQAQRITVLGFRNSYEQALYLQRQLLLLRERVLLLPSPGQTLGEDMADLSQDDLLIVIGLRRRVSQVARALEYGRATGAKIIYITDPSASTRTRRFADWVFISEVEGSAVFDSYVACQSLLNLMISLLFNRDMQGSYARMRRIEVAHDATGELDIAARARRTSKKPAEPGPKARRGRPA